MSNPLEGGPDTPIAPKVIPAIEEKSFDEERFEDFCCQTVTGWAAKKERLIYKAVKAHGITVDPHDLRQEVENYLDINQIQDVIEKVRERGHEWFLDELSASLGDLIQESASELMGEMGKQLDERLLQIHIDGGDELGSIMDTLEKRYGLTLGPAAEWFLVDTVGTMRTIALWLRYIAKQDPLPIMKRGFVKGLARLYVERGQEIPPKLRILLSHEDQEQLETKGEVSSKQEPQARAKLSEEFAKHDQQKEDALRAAGVHEKFIERIETARKEEETSSLHRVADILVNEQRDALEQITTYLKSVDDPRIVMDIILGTN
ncbi:MAG: hypothetical protein AAB463_01855 [Patescibacteria group bacterium]